MTKKHEAEGLPPVATNILGVLGKLTPDELSTPEDALSYSSLDGRCPSRQVIWFYCLDKVIRAIDRYERYAIPGSVAALKLKLSDSAFPIAAAGRRTGANSRTPTRRR
jgi:hypothetical protein